MKTMPRWLALTMCVLAPLKNELKPRSSARLFVLAFGFMVVSQGEVAAQSVHPGMGTGASGDVRVYFNDANLFAYGYSNTEVLDALLNAMEILNEEANADIHLYFAGYTSALSKADGVVVRFQDVHDCFIPDNPFGKAFRPFGTVAYSQAVLQLEECNGTPRDFRTLFGPGGQAMFEGIFLHELLHCVLGFPDTTGHTVMNYNEADTTHNNYRHLYKIDVKSAQYQTLGVTNDRAHTTTSSNVVGWSWSTPSLVPLSNYNKTSFAPSLDSFGNYDQVFAWPSAKFRKLALYENDPWSSVPIPSWTTSDFFNAVDVAASTYGELMVAWLGECSKYSHCPLPTAHCSGLGATTTAIPGRRAGSRPAIPLLVLRSTMTATETGL